MGRGMLRCFLVLAVVGGSASFGSARAEKVEESGLVFSATLGRTVLLPMEPIVLDVLLKNDGPSTFRRSGLEPLGPDMPVHVVTSAGERSQCLPALYEIKKGEWTDMRPGDTFAVRAVFIPLGTRDGRSGPLLTKPGNYTLEVGCTVFDPNAKESGAFGKAITLQAAPVKIQVATPGEQDAKALVYWREVVRDAGYLLPGTATDSEASVTLRETYGDTVYGLFVRYYHAQVPDRELQREDPTAHMAAAAEALEDFLPVALKAGFPLADDLLVTLADHYSMSSNFDAAAEAVRELEERFPESTARYRLQELPSLPNALRPMGPREPSPEQLPQN